MAKISPFRALRPQVALAASVASPPYDVLSSQEARLEATANPHSFLHITKSEADLEETVDVHDEAVYQKAKENLQFFVSKGILFREPKPCYYIYQLTMNGRSQTGLVCTSSVDDYENNIIRKHEFTRPDKELDRINHIKTTGAQTGNVFLAYPAVEAIDVLVELWKKDHPPAYDFVAGDGVKHVVWVVNEDETIRHITSLFEEAVSFTYIADGHHRAASAAKVRGMLLEKATGADYFLTTLFPSGQLQIMDYNRVIRDMNGMSEDEFLEKLGRNFEITKSATEVKPSKLHQLGMYTRSGWYMLTAKEGTFSTDPIGVLDVTILQELVLEPMLGIKDQRTDERIDFVGGIRGLGELVKRVESGEWAIAFSLFPVSIQQLFDIADGGNVMPPKSTWFEPKLRDGLLTHLIE